MKITQAMTRESYKAAKNIHSNGVSRKNGIGDLTTRLGMNEASAGDLINNFQSMLLGKEYHRTMNFFTTEYFLSNIRVDFGDSAFRTALNSVQKHLDYYDALQRGKHPKLRALLESLRSSQSSDVVFPDQVDQENLHFEGATKQVAVNVYERNPEARRKCLEKYGYNCMVCEFDFEKVYGAIGHNFIHVHHLVEISSIGKEYVIDPLTDLRPVCPNCHAMLHKQKPPLSIEELRKRLTVDK